MSKKESNILAVSFIVISCLVFGAYMVEEKKINSNTDAIFQNTQSIKGLLEMERTYQQNGNKFMVEYGLKIDSIFKNQKELLKLLNPKK